MAQKNRYLFRGRISERKFRDLLRLFALDITADRAAVLTGLHHNTALALYRLLRERMAELAQQDCPFRGQVELDESYFGPTRQRGKPGLGKGCGGWNPPRVDAVRRRNRSLLAEHPGEDRVHVLGVVAEIEFLFDFVL